jgi:hypothetical protein
MLDPQKGFLLAMKVQIPGSIGAQSILNANEGLSILERIQLSWAI